MSECRRYMDNYPGVRAECESNIAAGKLCYDCPKQPDSKESLASRLSVAEAELVRVFAERDALWALLLEARKGIEMIGCSPEGHDALCAYRDGLLQKIDAIDLPVPAKEKE